MSTLSLEGLKLSHTSMFRGYVSRKKPEGIQLEYKGRFGKGIKVLTPNFESTNYCFVTYYLEQEKK
jgi:hypothetical protein